MPRTEPSGKSLAPDLWLPINLAFRLRLLFGVGVSRQQWSHFLELEIFCLWTCSLH
jgi:hypothetical protein